MINEILKLLKVPLKQNYIKFDDNIYSNDERLIMGNPLSALFAEILMNNFKLIINKHKFVVGML